MKNYYMLDYTKQENYSGEHRSWTEQMSIPKDNKVVKEIRRDVLEECLDKIIGTNADLCTTPLSAYRLCIDTIRKMRDAQK